MVTAMRHVVPLASHPFHPTFYIFVFFYCRQTLKPMVLDLMRAKPDTITVALAAMWWEDEAVNDIMQGMIDICACGLALTGQDRMP
jgi:hypothetical protein